LAPDPVLIVSLMAWPKGHAIFSVAAFIDPPSSQLMSCTPDAC
jgi:hypothetical protein